MSKITVLGTGAMGSLMAMSLIKAGHQVTVWNRTLEKTQVIEQAGAKIAITPVAAVENAEFAIAMVRDDEASREVWLNSHTGAIHGLSTKTIAIESSTLSLSWTKELANRFQQQGIAFLDAPVAGTRPQAQAAQLIYFVGGDAAIFDQAKPILQGMGSTIHHVGITGNGMAIKLGVNSLFAIQVSAIAELLGLIHRCGLDKTQTANIIATTPVCSPAVKMAAATMIAGQFAPLFPIELVAKDLNYAIASARANSAKLPLVEAAHQVYTSAIERGHGDSNITGIARLYLSVGK